MQKYNFDKVNGTLTAKVFTFVRKHDKSTTSKDLFLTLILEVR